MFHVVFTLQFNLNENSMGCIFQDQYEYIGPKLARARNNYLLDGLTFKLVGFPSTYGKLLIVCFILFFQFMKIVLGQLLRKSHILITEIFITYTCNL